MGKIRHIHTEEEYVNHIITQIAQEKSDMYKRKKNVFHSPVAEL